MIADLLTILNAEGNSLVNEIKGNLRSTRTDATGKTSASLRLLVTQQGTKYSLKILGRPYFMTVETGRKPTPDKKPSRSMIDNIRAWTKAKGKPESMVWAIATSIQKKGTKLWQSGGRKDIVTEPINRMIPILEQSVLNELSRAFATTVKANFNVNSNR